jgi:hypothetical protein
MHSIGLLLFKTPLLSLGSASLPLLNLLGSAFLDCAARQEVIAT